ncbi:uncharacterized protein PG986_003854 [Apiospora aurea]|uniref:Uncharacterized protein n=1 Tax=Apiospora aurea TaxID=335848 RepID=A0ABR1QKW6_9PEZI
MMGREDSREAGILGWDGGGLCVYAVTKVGIEDNKVAVVLKRARVIDVAVAPGRVACLAVRFGVAVAGQREKRELEGRGEAERKGDDD